MLPGIFANMAPIIVRKHFKLLATPLDLKKELNKKRILGDNKTYRGLIFGILFAIIMAYIQAFLYNYASFQSISLINYEQINAPLLGFLIGFGVLLGDAVESFIKRRFNISPGQPFIPWDQIDSALGGIMFISFIYPLTFTQSITIILLAFLSSISTTHIGFYLGFRKKKW
jgi:CDP-2,3-bis-(O-geranylgeranyl)-sn-glycerol synthase